MDNNKMSKKENMIQAVKFVCFSASAGVIQVLVFTILDTVFSKVEVSGDQ